MQQLVNGWFLLFVALYFGHNMLIAAGYSIPIFRFYLGDVLACPVLLFMIRFTMRIVLAMPKLQLDLVMILSFWVFISVLFEFILPLFLPRYTPDYIDIIAYLFGCSIATHTTLKEAS